jgi:hypothetical protein
MLIAALEQPPVPKEGEWVEIHARNILRYSRVRTALHRKLNIEQ